MQKIRVYSSRKIFAVAVALCIACSLFIFMMSNEPATVSADRSGGIADVLAPWLVKDFDGLDSGEKAATLSSIDHVIRKIAHFCIYAALGALFTVASLWHRRTWLMHTVLPFVFGALYAASDEIHQAFVPGRGPLVTDVILDSCGVLCGGVFILAVVRILLSKRAQVDKNS